MILVMMKTFLAMNLAIKVMKTIVMSLVHTGEKMARSERVKPWS